MWSTVRTWLAVGEIEVTLLTRVVLVATLGARVAFNRSVFRLLVRGRAVCGTLLLVVPALVLRAAERDAEDLRGLV